MRYEERGPGNDLFRMGEKLRAIDVLLSEVYKIYVTPGGTNMDFVYGRMEEIAERLEKLAESVREWRG